MEREITRKDLSVLRTAGLKAFMAKLGVPWGREPGRTNQERRDALWARLAGDGGETATVDAAWWAAARAMASKDPPSKFEELEKVERRKLARTLTPGRGGNQDGAGPSRTPGTPRTPGQASGTQAESLPAPSSAEEKIRFSMDGDAILGGANFGGIFKVGVHETGGGGGEGEGVHPTTGVLCGVQAGGQPPHRVPPIRQPAC